MADALAAPMRFVDEFRDVGLARRWAQRIAADTRPGRRYRLMEFCGGHTHAIGRYGLPALLPPAVELVHGPGCPVCVLPVGRIDQAIRLALQHHAIVCSYGDALRVPASGGLSLLAARARGADVRPVVSVANALAIARANPQREVVFFAIGFETTTAPTALAILTAERERLRNFSVLCCHVLTPAAIAHLLGGPQGAAIDGIIGPAHVSVIVGSAAYAPLTARYRTPLVIAGFEPLDVLQAIAMLVRQINDGRAEVENQFSRAVTATGNAHAQALIARVLEPRSAFEWRGLGELPDSGLRIRDAYAAFDAERRFDLTYRPAPDHPGCACADVLRGAVHPRDCRLFARACTPAHPVGACMVSSEGACAAHYAYGHGLHAAATATTP